MENTLHKQLVEIQQKLKAPKNQKNTFGNYNYRSCEDILEAVKPLLNGIALILEDEVVNIGTKNYVKATVTITDGSLFESTSAYAREAEDKKGMDDAQITGAASSYARKYALNGLFAIDDTKDADTQDNTHHEVKKPVESQPSVSKPSVTIEGRVCPKCGSKLIHTTTGNGKELTKCSTNKWNAQKGMAEGCDFVEWGSPKQEEPPLQDIVDF